MPHSLSFNVKYDYNKTDDGITVPVVLGYSSIRVRVLAKLDTGASFCIFPREYGEELGIDIETGDKKEIATAIGPFITYGHELTLSALGYDVDSTVYFSSDFNFPRSVLGRHGWIERFRLGIVDYDGQLYVSHYDEP